MINRTYGTLSNLYDAGWGQEKSPLAAIQGNFKWSEVLGPTLADFPDSIKNVLDGNEYTELLRKYIWPKYVNKPIFYADQEYNWDGQETNLPNVTDVAQHTAANIMVWLLETGDEYVYLINKWKEIEGNLMAQLSSQSTTLFNDTPQAGGDFTTDPHVTNATKISTSTDTATPMARFKEIEKNIVSFYEEWSNKFGKRFVIYSAN